ncbi:unnamed protein product [Adineta ricciae]|uniref:Uncharacterized protein n=2 Tax=Adineta ricciae TaxID=249248 RepID=A0A814CA20_ADIRI|nr:unnamed protein product [Adineta ricciae]
MYINLHIASREYVNTFRFSIILKKRSISISFGSGILEFNPQLAGQDVTPANLEFGSVSSRRRERREKSASAASTTPGHQHPFYTHHTSSFTAINDETAPSTNQTPSIDPYQSSVEYRLQELTKRLLTLETKLSEDVSTVLLILRNQFQSNNL